MKEAGPVGSSQVASQVETQGPFLVWYAVIALNMQEQIKMARPVAVRK